MSASVRTVRVIEQVGPVSARRCGLSAAGVSQAHSDDAHIRLRALSEEASAVQCAERGARCAVVSCVRLPESLSIFYGHCVYTDDALKLSIDYQ